MLSRFADNNSIHIFPNPSFDKITIEWKSKSNQPSSIQLLDLTGREVMSEMVNTIKESSQTSIDISSLQTGVYILRVNNQTQSAVYKVVYDRW